MRQDGAGKARYHADQYAPLAGGGRNDLTNTVLACGPSNLAENDMAPELFERRMRKRRSPGREHAWSWCVKRCTIRAGTKERRVQVKRIPVSFRVTPEFKRALALAAEREQRSQTNLVEKLLFDFCRKAGIDLGNEAMGRSAKKEKKD